MAARVTVRHAMPGRLRLKVAGDPEEVDRILAAVEKEVRGREGVASVATDARTGSALVLFDPEALDVGGCVELLRKAHQALAHVVLPRFLQPTEKRFSEAAATVVRRFSGADVSVFRATHGVVNLRMLIPIGLAGLSVRQLLRYGPNVKSIPWYALAYYSFDTFIKLHDVPPSIDDGSAAEEGTPP